MCLIRYLVVFLISGCCIAADNQILSQQLKQLMQSKPEVKAMLVASIQEAQKVNPDKNYNPVQSLEDFLNYADEFAHTLPGQLPPGNFYHAKGTVTRESVHQNIMYFYFLVNQPLKALENKGYFKNTLQYYPPFNDWLISLSQEKGKFLSSTASWSEENFKQYRQAPLFNFDKGWYGQKNIWHSYNEFFSRNVMPGTRPIAGIQEPQLVVSPADSVPQGVWPINQNNQIKVKDGIKVKFISYFNIGQLLKGSHYSDAFKKGNLTHTYLNVNDFHRYLAPVSGTVLEKKIITENMSLDVSWNASTKRYEVLPSTGWQFSETRGYLIIKTDNNELMAMVPIGMEQVSSINFYDSVQVGQKIQKGQQVGYFLFGASDIIMLFQEKSHFQLTAPKDHQGQYQHVLAGESYGILHKKTR